MVKNIRLQTILFIILIVLVGVTLLKSDKEEKQSEDIPSSKVMLGDPANTTNPARERCLSLGGKIEMKKLPYGSQYGVCHMAPNRACEEWSLFRGECPKGGVMTEEFSRIEDKYCAWRGGRVIAEGASTTCYFRDERNCNTLDYYKGRCVGL